MIRKMQSTVVWVYFAPCFLLVLLMLGGCGGDKNGDLSAESSGRAPTTSSEDGYMPKSEGDETAPPELNHPPEFEAAPDAPEFNDVPDAAPPGDKGRQPKDEPADDLKRELVKVFYATDRASKFAIQRGDWLRVHRFALIALAVAILFGLFLFFGKRVWKLIILVAVAIALVTSVSSGYYATIEWQRRIRLSENDDPRYTSVMRVSRNGADLDYGICHVNIPPDHRVGNVETPSILRLEFSEDPDKHIILERVIPRDEQTFFDDLRARIDESEPRAAFVFIHGFNVGFDDAIKRTAQIAFDLKFQGAPICYTWPSRGDLEDYTQDLAHADDTVLHLQKFLEDVVSRTGTTNVHLVAHSMGNRAMLQALERMSLTRDDAQPLFSQIIMAAPDVSARKFRERFADVVHKMARNATLYASSRDWALKASTKVHGMDRAGLSGDQLVVVAGVDTIDVSEIDTSLIGHAYYGDNPELIRDLRALTGILPKPAADRTWLKQVLLAGGLRYWRFSHDPD